MFIHKFSVAGQSGARRFSCHIPGCGPIPEAGFNLPDRLGHDLCLGFDPAHHAEYSEAAFADYVELVQATIVSSTNGLPGLTFFDLPYCFEHQAPLAAWSKMASRSTLLGIFLTWQARDLSSRHWQMQCALRWVTEIDKEDGPLHD
jgi:hypothetical protein